jgi:hypothetical protein
VAIGDRWREAIRNTRLARSDMRIGFTTPPRRDLALGGRQSGWTASSADLAGAGRDRAQRQARSSALASVRGTMGSGRPNGRVIGEELAAMEHRTTIIELGEGTAQKSI